MTNEERHAIEEKIGLLTQVTMANGATPNEEMVALAKIALLEEKIMGRKDYGRSRQDGQMALAQFDALKDGWYEEFEMDQQRAVQVENK